MQLLDAMLKKTKVAPVKEMFHHWLETIRVSTAITCTSLVTQIAASIGALDGQDVTSLLHASKLTSISWCKGTI
jgi:hypothetical protein